MNTSPALAPGELVDEKEAAAILSIAVTTLRNWRTQRQGPQFVKVGSRLVRYRRSDLSAFLAKPSQQVAST